MGRWAQFVLVVRGDARQVDQGAPAEIVAIHRSADGGHTFAPIGTTQLPQLAGDPVPLLDGRLIVAAPGLTVGDAAGTRVTAAPYGGSFLGSIRHTDVGWVAYDVDGAGTAAYSTDGRDWRRLTIR